jgi:hypothetical protein
LWTPALFLASTFIPQSEHPTEKILFEADGRISFQGKGIDLPLTYLRQMEEAKHLP